MRTRKPLQIRISWPEGHLTATLDDTPTAQALAPAKALPFVSTARTWGKKVFFDTEVSVSRETGAREIVEPGTVAFWTDGDALALPYGPRRSPEATSAASTATPACSRRARRRPDTRGAGRRLCLELTDAQRRPAQQRLLLSP